MFSISPWDWPLESPVKFYLFNVIVLISFFFGYKKGILKNKFYTSNEFNKSAISRLLKISFLLNLIFIYPKFLFRLKIAFLSISDILNHIAIGFFTPGYAYADRFARTYEGFSTLSNPLVLAYNIVLPFLYLAIPLGIYFWDRLNISSRIILLVIIFLEILSYIAIGTNKGIFDIAIILPWLILAKNPEKYINYKMNFKKAFLLVSAVLVIFSALSYFVSTNIERKGARFYYEHSTQTYVSEDALVLKILPTFIQDSYLAIDSYLTQGYYPLGLALDMDFKSTYGMGNSFFLTTLGEKYFGKNYITDRTYQARIENDHGWSHYVKWHTFYTWIANDVSFWVVPIIIYYLACFFSQSWHDIIQRRNIYSIPVFSLFLIMITYFPANNQIFGFQGSLITFIVLFYIWRKNKIIVNTKGKI
tara:strand:- start:902 stop:2155 length:1254 start_codon:yes stop_codon:yes gene_type:complete